MKPEDLHERLRADLKQAMRDRDVPATRVIRRLMGAIGNAEAVRQPVDLPPQVVNPGNPVVAARSDVPRAELAPHDVARIVAAEIDDLDGAIAEYESHGEPERAADLRDEKDVLERYR
ncbi:MAG TPA: hypothetical protein VFZ37_08390 [Jiangellaceae bacterium]